MWNSHDFVKKIRGMDVNTEDKLISFDVKSLFTKVPIDLLIQIIRRRLTQDPNLEQQTPLDVSTIADLTELCPVMSSLSRRKGQPWDLLSPRW